MTIEAKIRSDLKLVSFKTCVDFDPKSESVKSSE